MMNKSAYETRDHRKVSVLNSGVFPILKVENFLLDYEEEELKQEIRNLLLFANNEGNLIGRDYHRVYLDAFWKNNRNQSKILTTMDKHIFSDYMYQHYIKLPESAFKLIPSSTAHETQLTLYKNNSKYNWHIDDDNLRIINFVYMVDMGMKFTGGHTQISNDDYRFHGDLSGILGNVDTEVALDIKPKGNQLIMMPMWVMHRVTPVKMQSTQLTDGRITINGHIGFRTFTDERTFVDRFSLHGKASRKGLDKKSEILPRPMKAGETTTTWI